MINKIGQPRSGSPICLITSMITDRIGRHEVLLPINHNFNKVYNGNRTEWSPIGRHENLFTFIVMIKITTLT